MKVHPSESRADTRRHALRGCAAGFFRHGSGVQWDAKKTAPGDKNHQGPGHAIGAPEPGYPLSGCVPAEPDSVSPDNSSVSLLTNHTQVSFRSTAF